MKLNYRFNAAFLYRDTWSIDSWFLAVVQNMIHDLRINSHGYPGSFDGTEEDIAREKREHTHRLYTTSDAPEYVEISKKWMAAEAEVCKYRDKCMKQGMALMTK